MRSAERNKGNVQLCNAPKLIENKIIKFFILVNIDLLIDYNDNIVWTIEKVKRAKK